MVDQETEVFLSLQFSMTWKFASGSCTQPLAACYSPPPPPTTQCKVTVTDCTPSPVSAFPLCPWPGLCGPQDPILSAGRMGMSPAGAAVAGRVLEARLCLLPRLPAQAF